MPSSHILDGDEPPSSSYGNVQHHRGAASDVDFKFRTVGNSGAYFLLARVLIKLTRVETVNYLQCLFSGRSEAMLCYFGLAGFNAFE